MKYPELVTKLVTHADAWLVGACANSGTESPRDYDIWVPVSKWPVAASLIPPDAKINRMGGFKCLSEGMEVDVWTCEMNVMLASNYFKAAFHPQTGVLIIRK